MRKPLKRCSQHDTLLQRYAQVRSFRSPRLSPHSMRRSRTARSLRHKESRQQQNALDELRRAEVEVGMGRSSLVTHAAPDKPAGVSDNVKPASITLRPRSDQPQETIGTPTNNRRITDLAEQEGRISTRALKPQ